MIPRRELEQLRAEWSLNLAVIEKDYVLGWLNTEKATAAEERLSRHPVSCFCQFEPTERSRETRAS